MIRNVWRPRPYSWHIDYTTSSDRSTARWTGSTLSRTIVSATNSSGARAAAGSANVDSSASIAVRFSRCSPSARRWNASRESPPVDSGSRTRPSTKIRRAPISAASARSGLSACCSSWWKSCRVVKISFNRPSRSSSPKSHPKSAASRMSLSEATSNRTITPGSSNWRAPRYTNSTPSVVFPVPAVPVTRTIFPRGMPPKRISSSPLSPVLTRSMSGIRHLTRVRDWLSAGNGFRLDTTRGPERRSLFEGLDDDQPPFPFFGDSQERRDPPAERAAPRENVELRGMGRVRGPSQEPGGDQGVERLSNLREVIPDVLGQAFGDEECPWMPIEEQQQIEVARAAQAPDPVEEVPDLLRRHGTSGYYRTSFLGSTRRISPGAPTRSTRWVRSRGLPLRE